MSQFNVFSPSLTLFKTLSPQEYLAYSELHLDQIPRQKALAAVVAVVSLAVFTVIAIVTFVFDDERKTEDLTFAEGVLALSFLTLCAATFQLGRLRMELPLLSSRVERLQEGLQALSNS